jgi:transcriptional regulator of acetoin/glycerol metabolism
MNERSHNPSIHFEVEYLASLAGANLIPNDWPGNAQELQTFIGRGVIRSDNEVFPNPQPSPHYS